MTRDEWPAEVLRRSVERVRTATEGGRHDELISAAARVADYVAAGTLPRARAEGELLAAAAAVGLDGRREAEARRCVAHGLGKGRAEAAWYPDSGAAEPVVRRYRWADGRIYELRSVPRPRPVLRELPVVASEPGVVRVTWYTDLRATQGTAEDWAWSEIAAAVSDPLPWPAGGKSGLPLWSLAEIEGDSRARRPDGLDESGEERTREPRVVRVHGIVLDYDDDDAWSCGLAATWWGQVRHVAHSTASHRVPKTGAPARPRGRVILDVSRPVSEAEYAVIARWLLQCGRGAIGAKELANPRRAYFVPASAPGGYEGRYHDGGSLDVDALLRQIGQEESEIDDDRDSRAPEAEVLEALDHTHGGAVRDSLRNVVEVLDRDSRYAGRLTRCLFSARDLLDGGPLRDSDEVEIACWLDEVYGLRASVDRVHQAAVAVAARHPVHPVREYLAGLRWDGEPRLCHWLVSWAGVEESRLAEVYGTRWLVSAVARVRGTDPRGVQADSALVLAGKKGLGKTSTLRILGGDWHSESTVAIGERDGYQQIQGVWIYELGEMSALRKSEVEAVKAFLTARIDRYRPPYGRNVVEVPRQCVFAGTTNDIDGFLSEGDRRWWVVRVVRRADLSGLAEVRDQLWAEAVHRYEAGEPWHLDGADEAAQQADVEQYRHVDPWEELVRERYVGVTSVVAADVLVGLLRRDQQESPESIRARATKGDQMRLARVLRECGWSRRDHHGRSTWER